MADELGGQIKAVEAEIAEVKDEIKKVTEQLKLVAQLEDPVLRQEQWAVLAEREKRLGTKEHDLREEKKLLMAKQQSPGVQIIFASMTLY